MSWRYGASWHQQIPLVYEVSKVNRSRVSVELDIFLSGGAPAALRRRSGGVHPNLVHPNLARSLEANVIERLI